LSAVVNLEFIYSLVCKNVKYIPNVILAGVLSNGTVIIVISNKKPLESYFKLDNI